MLSGAGLAFVGLLLLAGPDAVRTGLGPGEIATLLSTLPMAAEIVLISVFARKVDLGRVTVVQLLVAGLLGFAAMPAVGETAPTLSWYWVLPAVGLGAASCLIQATMNWAQKSVSPTRATIIYAGEPVWAGIFPPGRGPDVRSGVVRCCGDRSRHAGQRDSVPPGQRHAGRRTDTE